MENASFKISTEYDGKPRRLFVKSCEKCGADFWTPAHLIDKRRFCSLKCGYASLRNAVKMQCADCGAVVFRNPSKIAAARHGLVFCNRRCKERAQQLGGSCPEIRPSHFGVGNGKYDYRIRALLESDCCSGCGITEKFLLLVHHMDGDRDNNDLTNLEVVCGNCHVKRHLRYNGVNWIYDPKCLTPRELLTKLGP